MDFIQGLLHEGLAVLLMSCKSFRSHYLIAFLDDSLERLFQSSGVKILLESECEHGLGTHKCHQHQGGFDEREAPFARASRWYGRMNSSIGAGNQGHQA